MYNGHGYLNSDTCKFVKEAASKYPYCLEISEMPDMNDFEIVFADRTYDNSRSDCMGGNDYMVTMVGIPYCIVHKDFFNKHAELFIFFSDLNAKNTYINEFNDTIINKEPFSGIL